MTTRTFGGRVFEGRVTKLGASALEANAYPVSVALTEPDPRMRPGMTARVDFNFGGSVDETGWLIPINAVLPGDDSEGHYSEREGVVFVYRPDSATVERRTIRIAGLRDDSVEVSEGLAEGEVIAVAGVHFLIDGQRVALLEEELL
jgi:multidrug efflux pump subunit AcrA (membrane-fusion protein)